MLTSKLISNYRPNTGPEGDKRKGVIKKHQDRHIETVYREVYRNHGNMLRNMLRTESHHVPHTLTGVTFF